MIKTTPRVCTTPQAAMADSEVYLPAQEVGKGQTHSPALAFLPHHHHPLFSPEGGPPSIWQLALGTLGGITTMVLGCPTRRHSCSAPALHPCSCALRTDGRDASADGGLHCVPDMEAQRTRTTADDCQPHRCFACRFDKQRWMMDRGAAPELGSATPIASARMILGF